MVSAKHINWLNFGAFFGSCIFICGFTYEEVLKHFKRKKTPADWVKCVESTLYLWENDNWAFASKRTIDGRDYFVLVLKNKFDFKDDSHAKLAHEVLHLASFHLKEFLDPMQENECFAYTHTHLMTQCYKILRS